MHRHERHAVVGRGAVKVGIERDLVEEARERRVLRLAVEEGEDVGLELLHVLQPPAALHIALVLQRAEIAGLPAHEVVEVRKLRVSRRVVQRVDHGGEFLQPRRGGLERRVLPRRAEDRHHRHALLGGQRLHTLDARIADAAGGRIDDAPQPQIVRRIVDEREVGQHILDLGAVKEFHAADDLIRDAVALERVFQRVRLRVHAVEHRVVAPALAAVEVRHHAGDDKVRLVLLVEHGLDGHLFAAARVGPERLALAPDVVLNDGVRRVKNILRGTVVLLETDRARTLVFLFKIQDVGDVRAAEAIDALVVVADHADVAMAVRKQPHQLVLHPVRVLILVDEDVAEFALVVRSYIRLVLQQAHRVENEVVEVQRVRLAEDAVVARVNFGDALALPVAAARPLL